MHATFSSGDNQPLSGMGGPLVLEANKPGLNPSSTSDQCKDPGLGLAMD